MRKMRWGREGLGAVGRDAYHAGVCVMDLVAEADEILVSHRGSAGVGRGWGGGGAHSRRIEKR